MAYIEEGHDPALDRPTVTIRRTRPRANPRTPRELREAAIHRAHARITERRHQMRVMLKELDHVLLTTPCPEAFAAYKVLVKRLATLDHEQKALAPVAREVVRQQVINPPEPPPVVSPIERMRKRRERREWIAGWRERLKILEKNGRL